MPEAFDPNAAVPCFEAALKERPDDPMVRNALLLALDLVRNRQRKEREHEIRAARWAGEACVALMDGQPGGALSYITRARDLNPDDPQLKALSDIVVGLARGADPTSPAEIRTACKLVGHGVAALWRNDDEMAADFIEAAARLKPGDPIVEQAALLVRSFADGRVQAKPIATEIFH